VGGSPIDALLSIVDHLSDPLNARSPGDAQGLLASIPDEAGLYSWWADAEGLRELSAPFGVTLPRLVYAGQAGAASTRTGAASTATLRSRIGGNHLNGNIRSSTFRRTLAAVLHEALALRLVAGGRLDGPSNQLLSAWIRAHLSVAWVQCPDRGTLAALEDAVLRRLDPPLNLQGMPDTAVRLRLRGLRRGLGSAEAKAP
jgi:GIY-YIG catalytic domain-containing protein